MKTITEKSIQQRLERDFPQTLKSLKEAGMEIDWQYLISPFEVKISPALLKKLKDGVEAIHEISRRPNYQTQISPEVKNLPPNESILMSYDFHSSPGGEGALIEINTNASGFLIGCIGLAIETERSVFELSEIELFKKSILEEIRINGLKENQLHIAIVDEDIQDQKMRVEFFLYKELFEKWGWSAEICESEDVQWNESAQSLISPSGLKINFVYNRLTDFHLDQPKHLALRTAWLKRAITLSPQPKEYILLADKSRLMVFQDPQTLKNLEVEDELIEKVAKIVLPISEISSFQDKEELWKSRKGLFFKPKGSFGGKAVYRGESVSRRVFDRLLEENGLVQKFFPAQKLSDDPNNPLNIWKFDLRCFAYKGEVHLVTARVYQGQVTNFSQRFGGFSSVNVSP